MSQEQPSTELSLAILSSLFERVDQTELLEVLIRNDGDVDRAAAALRDAITDGDDGRPRKKRKVGQGSRTGGLKSWLLPLQKSARVECGDGVPGAGCPLSTESDGMKGDIPVFGAREQSGSTSAHAGTQVQGREASSRPSASPSPSKPVRSIHDALLSSRSTESTSTNRSTPALAPLILSSPAQIEAHKPELPITLILNVLPKELAARLLIRMVDESVGVGNTKIENRDVGDLGPEEDVDQKVDEEAVPKKGWEQPRWYLAGREVTSSHSGSFYVQPSANVKNTEAMASAWNYGRHREAPPPFFPEEMREAGEIVERVVNENLGARERLGKRFDLEFDGPWKANIAAANCYRGSKQSVGYHSDRLTHLGPYPTIGSVSLGTTRTFHLRSVPTASSNTAGRTYSVTLPHNSLLIMHAGCQEHFKHEVPKQRNVDVFRLKEGWDGTGAEGKAFIERINITFRFYRPDFAPLPADVSENAASPSKLQNPTLIPARPQRAAVGTPYCQCGVPCILRPDMKGKAAALLNKDPSRYQGQGEVEVDSRDELRFFWQCNAGEQNEGKSCGHFRFLNMKGEGRGPTLGERRRTGLQGG